MIVIAAAEALRNLNAPTEGLAELVAAKLAVDNATVKEAALVALAQFGRAGYAAAPAVVQRLNDPNETVQLAPAAALKDMAPADAAIAQAMAVSLADNKNSSTRLAILTALAEMGLSAQASGTAVAAVIENADAAQDLRIAGFAVLAKFGADPTALACLGRVITEKKNSASLRAVALLGPSAAGCLEPTRASLADSSPIVSVTAASALGEMAAAAKPAVPDLVRMLRSRDLSVYKAAATAVGRIGPDARDAVPVLAADLSDRSAEIRLAALAALANFGSEAKSAVPHLTRVLKNDDTALRRNALVVLAEIGPAAAASTVEVQSLLRDRDPETRRLAIYALGNVAPAGDAAVAAVLIGLLKDPATEIRAEACAGLGRLRSGTALAPLKEAAGDRSRIVRDAAEAASLLILRKE